MLENIIDKSRNQKPRIRCGSMPSRLSALFLIKNGERKKSHTFQLVELAIPEKERNAARPR